MGIRAPEFPNVPAPVAVAAINPDEPSGSGAGALTGDDLRRVLITKMDQIQRYHTSTICRRYLSNTRACLVRISPRRLDMRMYNLIWARLDHMDEVLRIAEGSIENPILADYIYIRRLVNTFLF
jgi:hypothetical protein